MSTSQLPLDSDALLSALNWRYATKKFDPAKKISPENWKTLEDVLVLTPSSFGLQPWKFYRRCGLRRRM
jgi:nitroreductase